MTQRMRAWGPIMSRETSHRVRHHPAGKLLWILFHILLLYLGLAVNG